MTEAQCGDCGFHYREQHNGHIIPCPRCANQEARMLLDGAHETIRRQTDEIRRFQRLLNTPMIDGFLEAVRLEAAHQKERWGAPHDRSKSAENWYWLVGYLAGKALRATIEGNREKALHHTISSAAALMNWHESIALDTTGCGLGEDQDLQFGVKS